MVIFAAEFPPGPGGIGTHAYQVALQLQRHGWTVSVVAVQELAEPDAIDTFNKQAPFPIRRVEQYPGAPTKLAYRLGVLARTLTRERPSLVVATGERMVWIAAAVCPLFRVPFVAVGHAMEFNAPARWQRILNRRSFEAATGVVSVSQYTASRMVAAGIQPRASTVIPNGADESRFQPVPAGESAAFLRRHGLERATVLVTVGSVHERKGQDVVIRALPEIIARFPDVHYLLVGAPHRQESFAKLATSLGVADRVHFLGLTEARDIVRALTAATLFLMTSQHTPDGDFEGYGIAVVEAALCGRAAVVSDNSGVVEAIEPGETGLVASISDPVSTAARVIELLGDRERLARMGELARERALHGKTWAHRGAVYDRFLRGLVDAALS
ncbi:MAG: glycosyltransferase family 4 protein [Myxococcota bacterium]|nr:glycosyltransferase family 4 protein [Myxococcota bacterium]